ncbi:MAG: DnaJ domain-containing protein [Chloroflexota bacterium]
MAKEPDYYAVLGVRRDATQEEIKRAYLQAAQRLHPDKNKLAGETEIFLAVQQAYEVLSNPKRRSQYDALLPPEQKGPSLIEYQAHYSRPNLVRLKEHQMVYILLELAPSRQSTDIPIPPLNVCLTLDCSTSMKGEKMDMLKAAAINVLRDLRPQDIFSVVTFSDRAEVLIPASYRPEKRKLESHIRTLQPSGATEIFQGIEAAYKEVQANADGTRVNHIILITDGHTYGDEPACLNLAEEAAQKGIGISAMGIGKEWNDVFLDALCSHTGGSSKYVSKPDDIHKFLVDEFETLSRVVASDVLLEFTGAPGAEITYAFRTQPEAGPLPVTSPIHLGAVLQDTPLNVLFEYRIDPSLVEQDEVTLLAGSMKPAVAGLPTPIPPIPLDFSRPVKNEAGMDPPHPGIIHSLGKLTLYRIQDKARAELNDGQYELAAQHLKQLATNLLAQGERSLARTALIEAENILQMQSLSEEGSKAIKYGTRSLLMKQR